MSKICPYCFEKININKTPFRCVSPFSRCVPEKDNVLETIWNDRRPYGKVISSETCSTCGQKSNLRLCQHCHQEIPYSYFNCDNYIFTIIGSVGSGKSFYIASLIKRIQEENVGLNILIEPANVDTHECYHRKYREPLANRECLPMTLSGFIDHNEPLIFKLIITNKGLFGVKTKAITISFFDVCGSDLNNSNDMMMLLKHIIHANGILLLLDPLQLDEVRNLLQGKIPLPAQGEKAEDIISRVTSLVHKGRELPSNTKIKTPFAVALSKWDAVKTLASNQLQVNTAAKIQDTFNLSDFDAVNAEVQSLIKQWDSEYLIQQVETHFVDYGFFGLSSLGAMPTETGAIPHITPHRVTDPFLWLLYKNGLIKATN